MGGRGGGGMRWEVEGEEGWDGRQRGGRDEMGGKGGRGMGWEVEGEEG